VREQYFRLCAVRFSKGSFILGRFNNDLSPIRLFSGRLRSEFFRQLSSPKLRSGRRGNVAILRLSDSGSTLFDLI